MNAMRGNRGGAPATVSNGDALVAGIGIMLPAIGGKRSLRAGGVQRGALHGLSLDASVRCPHSGRPKEDFHQEQSHYRNLDESLPVEEIGSGTIIKAADNYYVLTNRHVVRDAAETDIQIQLWDGQIIFPSKVYADASTDIWLLAIRAERLTAARLGDSDKTAVGICTGLRQSVWAQSFRDHGHHRCDGATGPSVGDRGPANSGFHPNRRSN